MANGGTLLDNLKELKHLSACQHCVADADKPSPCLDCIWSDLEKAIEVYQVFKDTMEEYGLEEYLTPEGIKNFWEILRYPNNRITSEEQRILGLIKEKCVVSFTTAGPEAKRFVSDNYYKYVTEHEEELLRKFLEDRTEEEFLRGLRNMYLELCGVNMYAAMEHPDTPVKDIPECVEAMRQIKQLVAKAEALGFVWSHDDMKFVKR